jgi:hypothetical protein
MSSGVSCPMDTDPDKQSSSLGCLLREVKKDRLPARCTVLIQQRGVDEKSVLRRLYSVRAVNMPEAMELRLDPDHRTSQGRAALSTVQDALRWTVGNARISVSLGMVLHNVSRSASSLIPKAPLATG